LEERILSTSLFILERSMGLVRKPSAPNWVKKVSPTMDPEIMRTDKEGFSIFGFVQKLRDTS